MAPLEKTMNKSVTAEALRRARIRCGISQSDLARRAGISRQALSAIESGTYQPSVGVALALARELHAHAAYADDVGFGLERDRLHVLVDDAHVPVRRTQRGERGEAQRRIHRALARQDALDPGERVLAGRGVEQGPNTAPPAGSGARGTDD